MPEDAPCDPQWWQAEKALSLERKRLAAAAAASAKLGDSFLIVTEGEVTERMYFEATRETLQVNPVTVRVVHPACTDAEGLVRAAIQERDAALQGRNRSVAGNRNVSRYDHVWVLFDTDVPARQAQLGPAIQLATNESIHVAHSTPSVEIWLLLHFRDRPGPLLDSAAAEHAVGDAWGQRYEKTAETFPKLWLALKPNIPVAVSRAAQVRKYHQDANTAFPPNPSTQLDLLVRALDASVQQPLRILL